jgi:DNA mismatch repair protein MutS
MMEQYLQIKEKYKYCLLFYRLGDFYELFFEDALIASRELEITLTGKDCGMEERAPMCGVPFHSADGYIAKLVEKGYKVAICEQVEDPKTAKGIVKRDVIRVVTPGTQLDTNVLEEGKNNYIMCLYLAKGKYGVAVCDVSTGEFLTTVLNSESKVIDEIARFVPSEILANAEVVENSEGDFLNRVEQLFDLKISTQPSNDFVLSSADICLCNHFKVLNLGCFGLDEEPLCVCACGALMHYLTDTQKNSLNHISTIKKYTSNKYMVLDISSRRNLELTQTIRDKGKKGSLLWVLDKTKTAMGARLLRSFLEQPLVDVEEITKRLDAVEILKNAVFDRADLQELLGTVYDIERLMGRVVYGTANARDLVALRASFENIPHIKRLLTGLKGDYIVQIADDMDELEDIFNLINTTIADEPPFSVREGGIIKTGADEEIDKLRAAKEKGSTWLMELETREREATGIKNLKVKYNKVFGYYIEVSNGNLSMVPERYTRKQTLANCERYITGELKEIEDVILKADEALNDMEYDLFAKVRSTVAANINRIQKTAKAISLCDVLQSLAEVAEKNGYVKPKVDTSGELEIVNGRHPVVERTITDGSFIPNDVCIDTDTNRLAVITGPNMAGKSTYMRQTALIVIMAQIGSFVPASKARIGIVDRVFTRVGASDDLATGQSTFMVEMVEVANILNNATQNSLLILDEIGRGTSTFDGLSIAWAVLEHIARNIGARTLFATHYHELTELEGKVDGVKNYCVLVKEQGEKVIFLRKIVMGSTDRSYGIHVAKLAGVPKSVTNRAEELLNSLSGYKPNTSGMLQADGNSALNDSVDDSEDYVYPDVKPERVALKFSDTVPEGLSEVGDELLALDVNAMSPLDALKKLYELKEKLSRNNEKD